jgi:hypothetical protein
MRAYVMTTGTIFGLIALAHVWRIFAERRELVTDPVFLLLTLAAMGLCIWAVRLLRISARA